MHKHLYTNNTVKSEDKQTAINSNKVMEIVRHKVVHDTTGLSSRFYNRLNNRLHRVNGLHNRIIVSTVISLTISVSVRNDPNHSLYVHESTFL